MSDSSDESKYSKISSCGSFRYQCRYGSCYANCDGGTECQGERLYLSVNSAPNCKCKLYNLAVLHYSLYYSSV